MCRNEPGFAEAKRQPPRRTEGALHISLGRQPQEPVRDESPGLKASPMYRDTRGFWWGFGTGFQP